MNYLDKDNDNESYMNRIHNKIIRILRKWNDPNEGATTEELRDLRFALSVAKEDVSNIISLRESDERG